MAQTIVGLNDPKAVKKYSAFLAHDVGRESYFNRKFMGVGVEAQTPLQTLPQLESDAGEQITYDLVMQLKMQPVEGDNTLEGKEEDLKFYTDSVYIDQVRGGVNTGGRMTRKRTIHNLRAIARVKQGEWWARIFDELIFMYLSGGRGVNPDYTFPIGYPGLANNSFVAPDADHTLYPNAITAKNAITSSDTFNLGLIDKAVTRAATIGGGTTGIPSLEPVRIEGEERYVLVMHPWQEHALRVSTVSNAWLDINKALTTAVGNRSPIFTGALGYYRGVVLHSHKAVVRFGDYGVGANLQASRALFMGRQAGVVAFGSPGTGLRFGWHEESRDNANQAVISTSSIFGVKKSAFTINGVSRDFGLMSLDTYAIDPT